MSNRDRWLACDHRERVVEARLEATRKAIRQDTARKILFAHTNIKLGSSTREKWRKRSVKGVVKCVVW
jgi:hypothetical protein